MLSYFKHMSYSLIGKTLKVATLTYTIIGKELFCASVVGLIDEVIVIDRYL